MPDPLHLAQVQQRRQEGLDHCSQLNRKVIMGSTTRVCVVALNGGVGQRAQKWRVVTVRVLPAPPTDGVNEHTEWACKHTNLCTVSLNPAWFTQATW